MASRPFVPSNGQAAQIFAVSLATLSKHLAARRKNGNGSNGVNNNGHGNSHAEHAMPAAGMAADLQFFHVLMEADLQFLHTLVRVWLRTDDPKRLANLGKEICKEILYLRDHLAEEQSEVACEPAA